MERFLLGIKPDGGRGPFYMGIPSVGDAHSHSLMLKRSKAMAGSDIRSFSRSITTSTASPSILLTEMDLGRYIMDKDARIDARHIKAIADSLKYVNKPTIKGMKAAEILEESSTLLFMSRIMDRHADKMRDAVK